MRNRLKVVRQKTYVELDSLVVGRGILRGADTVLQPRVQGSEDRVPIVHAETDALNIFTRSFA